MHSNINTNAFIFGLISLSLVVVCFALYFIITKQKGLSKWLINRFGNEGGQLRQILINRLLGVFLFCLLPLLFILYFSNGYLNLSWLSAKGIQTSLFYYALLLPIILFINSWAAKRDDNLVKYPQIRKKRWDYKLLIISALSWSVYIFAYEFLFRGFLFFAILPVYGLAVAIIVNILVYSLVHIHKGKHEALGAIPMGLLLCLITYHTGTIWFAVIYHASLSLTNEWFSLKNHPDIKLG